MRIRHALLSWAVSATASITLAPPAQAQGFFQKLFGFGSSAPALSVQPRYVIPPQRYLSHRRFGGEQSHVPEGPASEDEDIGPSDSGGPYRTMCVRACDGFYFPLRHNARHKNFAADAKSCRSACGEEGRLFYYPEESGSTETMADLAGRRYAELPHALAYRKALVQGCTCKPVPWSNEEAARHQAYAVALAESQVKPAEEPKASEPEQRAPQPAASGDRIVQDGNENPSLQSTQKPNDADGSSNDASKAAPVEAQTPQAKAAEPETYEPVREKVQKPQPAPKHKTSSAVQRERPARASYRTTSSQASSGGWFGGGKKYVWPGDAR
jgi:hypothetical protein